MTPTTSSTNATGLFSLALVESNLQILCESCNHGKGNWNERDSKCGAPVGECPHFSSEDE